MQDKPADDSPVSHSYNELDESKKEVIRRALNRILESAAFRTSRRSQHCLRFIVEKTLEGQFDHLKERCIGAEVFGRTPDYDTNTDAVVRISANDLRKRLAQYHVLAGPDDEVRIDLPAGCYHAEFHWPAAQKPEAGATPIETPAIGEKPTPTRLRRFRELPKLWLLAGTSLVLLALGLAWLGLHRPKNALEQFWAPVLQSPKPILIAPGHPVVYLLSRRIHDEYDANNPPDVESGPHVAKLGSAVVPAIDIVPVTDQYVGAGDAVTMARLMEMFGRLGKPAQIRFGDESSFADLRGSPTVLIGAFSNRWNLELGRELRFNFEWRGHAKMVTDHSSPGRIWQTEMDSSGHTRLDYALVSRTYDANTGQLVVQAAGVTQYGTQAAGEFLTDSRYWEPILRQAPKGWASKNMQIVIRARVIGNAPGNPEVVAIHYW